MADDKLHRYYPELPRQRCPACRHALARTPDCRKAGTLRIRYHQCPVMGCGNTWRTAERIAPLVATTTTQGQPVNPPVHRRKPARRG